MSNFEAFMSLLPTKDDAPVRTALFGDSEDNYIAGAQKKAKSLTSSYRHVFFFDNTKPENDENAELYATQFGYLEQLWSLYPCCKIFKVNASHFLELEPFCNKTENKLDKAPAIPLGALQTGLGLWDHPILALTKSDSDTLDYVGSCVQNDGVPSFMAGSVSIKEKGAVVDELDMVLSKWKHNDIDEKKDDDRCVIIIACDVTLEIELMIRNMLQNKYNLHIAPMPNAVTSAMCHLIENYREKVSNAIEAEKKAKEEAELAEKKRLEMEKENMKRKAESKNIEKSTKKKQKNYIGTLVAKDFDDLVYVGEIKATYITDENEEVWSVLYNDGDEEDMNEKELIEGLTFYNKVQKYPKKYTLYDPEDE